jgi:hypothetical protein
MSAERTPKGFATQGRLPGERIIDYFHRMNPNLVPGSEEYGQALTDLFCNIAIDSGINPAQAFITAAESILAERTDRAGKPILPKLERGDAKNLL